MYLFISLMTYFMYIFMSFMTCASCGYVWNGVSRDMSYLLYTRPRDTSHMFKMMSLDIYIYILFIWQRARDRYIFVAKLIEAELIVGEPSGEPAIYVPLFIHQTTQTIHKCAWRTISENHDINLDTNIFCLFNMSYRTQTQECKWCYKIYINYYSSSCVEFKNCFA